MTGLPTNGKVVELTIGYATKKSGSYAIDYLTQYQRLLPHVTFAHTLPEVINPLDGIAGVGSVVTTAPIPLPTVNAMIDPDGADSSPAVPQPSTSMSLLPAAERVMTLYGGTLIDVTYVTQGDVSLAATTSETQVKVRFTANTSTAVLAWGGHLASRWEWGFNADGTPRSSGGISGSSYHMRLVTWNLNNLGNQDRSLSTDAVIAMPQCGISNQGPFCANTTNTHVGPGLMSGYQWSLFDNTSGATIVSGDTSRSVIVNSGSGGHYGSCSSPPRTRTPSSARPWSRSTRGRPPTRASTSACAPPARRSRSRAWRRAAPVCGAAARARTTRTRRP
jgi:hypothetical protein